jgi:hypothetical protein
VRTLFSKFLLSVFGCATISYKHSEINAPSKISITARKKTFLCSAASQDKKKKKTVDMKMYAGGRITL